MTLEQSIAYPTAALNRNSDLLEGLTAKAKAGVEAAGAGTLSLFVSLRLISMSLEEG